MSHGIHDSITRGIDPSPWGNHVSIYIRQRSALTVENDKTLVPLTSMLQLPN